MSYIAGVVQWLVHGLAKARMPVRFWSLAPKEYEMASKSWTESCVINIQLSKKLKGVVF